MTGANNKVAIVTGAAKGIGEAIALRLAKDGFAVALADLAGSQGALAKVAAAAAGLGAKTATIACDVRSKADVDALVAETVQQLGRVDVMVANAGICKVGPLLDVTEDDIDSIYAVNVKGVLYCYQAAARQMIKQGEGGRLIAACSVAGMRGHASFGAYCASKFAVRALNQTAAVEFAPHKIICNVYCPSPVDTDMWTNIDKDLTGAAGVPLGAVTKQFVGSNPLGRIVVAEDVANLVSFFASPDCSFTTGESVLVSGGDFMQ